MEPYLEDDDRHGQERQVLEEQTHLWERLGPIGLTGAGPFFPNF